VAQKPETVKSVKAATLRLKRNLSNLTVEYGQLQNYNDRGIGLLCDR
jgi:hypothetical protein